MSSGKKTRQNLRLLATYTPLEEQYEQNKPSLYNNRNKYYAKQFIIHVTSRYIYRYKILKYVRILFNLAPYNNQQICIQFVWPTPQTSIQFMTLEASKFKLSILSANRIVQS